MTKDESNFEKSKLCVVWNKSEVLNASDKQTPHHHHHFLDFHNFKMIFFKNWVSVCIIFLVLNWSSTFFLFMK